MFNRLIAIDVRERVPDFDARMRALSVHEPLCVATASQALSSSPVLSDVDGVVISIHQALTEDELKKLPALRYIGVLGTSLKKLPMAACAARQIIVRNITEYCDEDTAEWVIMKILEHFREAVPARSAAYKILGIIGVGAVGKNVMALGRALHMQVVINSRHDHPELLTQGIKSLSKEDIFRVADVVSIHTPAFMPWIDAKLLRQARKNLCIIDTCMGRVSVDNDLEAILDERPDITVIMDKIAGAHYPQLTGRAKIFEEAAFMTADAEERLIEKFFGNLGNFLHK